MCINFDIVRALLQITPSLISLFRKVSSEVTRLLTPFECKSFLITAINGVGTTSAVCGPTAGNISFAKKSAFPSFLGLKFHIFRRVFNLPRPHTIKLQLNLTLHNTERLLCLAISSSKSPWAIKVRSGNDKLLLILAPLFFGSLKLLVLVIRLDRISVILVQIIPSVQDVKTTPVLFPLTPQMNPEPNGT